MLRFPLPFRHYNPSFSHFRLQFLALPVIFLIFFLSLLSTSLIVEPRG